MKIENKFYEINYNEEENSYIEKVNNYINNMYKDILDFFNLKEEYIKLNINFYNDKTKYNKILIDTYNAKVDENEIVHTINTGTECTIYILNLEERRKCINHKNDTIEDINKTIIHELTKICLFIYNHNQSTYIWFIEGLASNLSKENNIYKINSSLEDIMNMNAEYNNYYTIVKYLLDNNDKDYILKLTKDSKLLKEELNKVYNILNNK